MDIGSARGPTKSHQPTHVHSPEEQHFHKFSLEELMQLAWTSTHIGEQQAALKAIARIAAHPTADADVSVHSGLHWMLIGMLEDAVMAVFEDVMQDDKAPNGRACSTADATQASSSASKLALACELARAMDTLICGSSRHAEVLSLEGACHALIKLLSIPHPAAQAAAVCTIAALINRHPPAVRQSFAAHKGVSVLLDSIWQKHLLGLLLPQALQQSLRLLCNILPQVNHARAHETADIFGLRAQVVESRGIHLLVELCQDDRPGIRQPAVNALHHLTLTERGFMGILMQATQHVGLLAAIAAADPAPSNQWQQGMGGPAQHETFQLSSLQLPQRQSPASSTLSSLPLDSQAGVHRNPQPSLGLHDPLASAHSAGIPASLRSLADATVHETTRTCAAHGRFPSQDDSTWLYETASIQQGRVGDDMKVGCQPCPVPHPTQPSRPEGMQVSPGHARIPSPDASTWLYHPSPVRQAPTSTVDTHSPCQPIPWLASPSQSSQHPQMTQSLLLSTDQSPTGVRHCNRAAGVAGCMLRMSPAHGVHSSQSDVAWPETPALRPYNGRFQAASEGMRTADALQLTGNLQACNYASSSLDSPPNASRVPLRPDLASAKQPGLSAPPIGSSGCYSVLERTQHPSECRAPGGSGSGLAAASTLPAARRCRCDATCTCPNLLPSELSNGHQSILLQGSDQPHWANGRACMHMGQPDHVSHGLNHLAPAADALVKPPPTPTSRKPRSTAGLPTHDKARDDRLFGSLGSRSASQAMPKAAADTHDGSLLRASRAQHAYQPQPQDLLARSPQPDQQQARADCQDCPPANLTDAFSASGQELGMLQAMPDDSKFPTVLQASGHQHPSHRLPQRFSADDWPQDLLGSRPDIQITDHTVCCGNGGTVAATSVPAYRTSQMLPAQQSGSRKSVPRDVTELMDFDSPTQDGLCQQQFGNFSAGPPAPGRASLGHEGPAEFQSTAETAAFTCSLSRSSSSSCGMSHQRPTSSELDRRLDTLQTLTRCRGILETACEKRSIKDGITRRSPQLPRGVSEGHGPMPVSDSSMAHQGILAEDPSLPSRLMSDSSVAYGGHDGIKPRFAMKPAATYSTQALRRSGRKHLAGTGTNATSLPADPRPFMQQTPAQHDRKPDAGREAPARLQHQEHVVAAHTADSPSRRAKPKGHKRALLAAKVSSGRPPSDPFAQIRSLNHAAVSLKEREHSRHLDAKSSALPSNASPAPSTLSFDEPLPISSRGYTYHSSTRPLLDTPTYYEEGVVSREAKSMQSAAPPPLNKCSVSSVMSSRPAMKLSQVKATAKRRFSKVLSMFNCRMD